MMWSSLCSPSRLMAFAAMMLACNPLAVRADEPQGQNASLRIHSVRVSREANTDLLRRFSRGSYGDSSSGMSLQFLLTIREGEMLPIEQDAVTVETFVDDTYQSLLSTSTSSRATYYGGSPQPALSDDARTLLFAVVANRPPAEDAGRVFVRGSIRARISRGKTETAKSQIALAVGQETMVGPFRTTIRSISASSGTANLMLSVQGDALRIKKVLVIDSKGDVVNDERLTRSSLGVAGDRGVTTNAMLHFLPKEPVTLEYCYLADTENVQIPFEAQVDLGVTKAGPVEAVAASSGPGKNATRRWPPASEPALAAMPARRTPFVPPTKQPNAPAETTSTVGDRATVDLFSLTVAKALPSETQGVKWKSPPSPTFHAAGFTIARLMVSTPGATILSIPADGVSINRYEDDKGGKLDTAMYREGASPYFITCSASTQNGQRSTDGQQVLLNLPLASAPTPGATCCTLAGSVRTNVAVGERVDTSEAIHLRTAEKILVGPFKGEVARVRLPAPLTPATLLGSACDVWLSINGPVSKLQTIEIIDSEGVRLGMADQIPPSPETTRAESIVKTLRLSISPAGPVKVRIRSYETEEVLQIPFEISTGIGL